MSSQLAVIILTLNEEDNIRECINSVDFADEIIIVDSGSKDNTCRIAADMGAKICYHSIDEDGFAGQRNFGLEQTCAEWVLYLDADERVTPELANEIHRHIGKKSMQAAEIKRMSVVMGKLMKHGVYRPDYVMRLFPREHVHWDGLVHEKAVTDLPVISLKGYLRHYCLNSWEQYFRKFDKYTSLMAEKMLANGKRTNAISMHLHAAAAFFQMYVLKLGFLDGLLGFMLCQYHYFYTLTKYVKLSRLHEKNHDRG